MNHRARSQAAAGGRSKKHDFNILSSVTHSLGLTDSLNLRKISASELNIIRKALAEADKVRVAGWDPGAAYLSGVLEVITAMRNKTAKRIRKLPPF